LASNLRCRNVMAKKSIDSATETHPRNLSKNTE
jgi:hypothetical protein